MWRLWENPVPEKYPFEYDRCFGHSYFGKGADRRQGYFSMNDRKLTVFRRRNIGFIFQAFNLIPELTVEQNMIFPMLLDYQKPDRKYLEELLTVLN